MKLIPGLKTDITWYSRILDGLKNTTLRHIYIVKSGTYIEQDRADHRFN